jgi:multidrug efflux pump subunit AcrA (membrane-fusion protein)
MRTTIFLWCCIVALSSFGGVVQANQSKVKTTFKASATVYSKFELGLSTEIDGRIVTIVNAGQKVQKGQVIVRLADEYEQKMKQHYLAKQKLLNQQHALLKQRLARAKVLSNSNNVSIDQHEQRQLDLLALELQQRDLSLKVTAVNQIIRQKQVIATHDGVILARKAAVSEVAMPNVPIITMLASTPLYIKVALAGAIVKQLDMSRAVFSVSDAQPLAVSLDYIAASVNVKTNTVDASFQLPVTQWMPGEKGTISIEYLQP